MDYPKQRPRRLRKNEKVRELVQETSLDMKGIIAPLFVKPGKDLKDPINSLPGQFQMSPDVALKEAKALRARGVSTILLFGIPETKDATGSSSCSEDGIVQTTTRLIKEDLPDLLIAADLCFCEYTDHGHCGILDGTEVNNDETLIITQKQAISLCEAGADIIAPSGMMDGVVDATRNALDESGFKNTIIMAYSAKFASAYYGPFREAAGSAPSFGDRRSYQMDPANADEALREIELDIEEGADIVMVKPALAYLDIIAKAKDSFNIPLAAYNVSGEYAMIKAAGASGLVDENQVMLETLLSIKRAGADIIITYFARELSEALQ